ncbi:MAG: 3-methyl-2-oxobutanoate hydroxymethyltransferase [Candidatus Adiutrix sp.]|jgi:3-methyl-2-oxobutanoate hydroxymethyltransferase|nr:3-methyl-2-oxobutanoate hydroxymethyltransferase [Candidatus Adiutrix sp.]
MKLTRLDFEKMKKSGVPVAWITAYDYHTARFAERAGLEMLLVGDSLGMCVYGYEGTIPVTMDQCLLHSEAVRRGAPDTFVVGDMPFLSYQVSVPDAVANAGRFFKEARVDAVKLEGGRRVLPQIRAITEAGMLLMGHIGLTPQSSGQLGGFKAQGRTAEAAVDLIEDALAVEEAGAFALVLEGVPSEVCGLIRERLRIPVYGVGAGLPADGQLMTSADLLGLFKMFTPKFVKAYADLGGDMERAFKAYAADVKAGTFPGPEHCYAMLDGEWDKLRKLIAD